MNVMAAWLPPLRAAFAPGSRYANEALEPAHARRAASPPQVRRSHSIAASRELNALAQ